MFNKLNDRLIFNIEQARHYVLLALFFSIPLVPKVTTILTILFVLVSLFDFKNIKIKRLLNHRGLMLFIVFYLLLIMGLVYSIDSATGFSKVQTQISFIVFPLFLGTQAISSITRYQLGQSFVYGVLATVVLAFINGIYRFFIKDGLYVLDTFSRKHNIFIYDEFSKFLGLHPTYFSIYLGLALFYLAFTWSRSSIRPLPLRILLVVLLFVALFLTSSKAGIFSFLLLIFAYFVYMAYKTRNKIYFMLIILLISSATIMFLSSPTLSNRFEQMISSVEKVFFEDEKIRESTGIRLNLWHVSIEAAKEKWFFGHGTGSVFKVLNEKCIDYYSFSVCEGLRNKNCHNEYMNVLVSNGLFALVFFLAALVFSFMGAIKKGDVLLGFFILFMTINFLFESLLQRERGVLFFMIFLVMLAVSSESEKKD